MKPEDQEWYSNALEVLSPLRFHLFMLIQDIESKQRWSKAAGLPFGIAGLEAAKSAAGDAELFFTGSRGIYEAKP